MNEGKSEIVPVQVEQDVVLVRQRTRIRAEGLRFSLVDQTKLVTAASELARNTVVYGKGGKMTIEELRLGIRTGLKLTFEDKGPGIADIELALRDGYTTGSGLGLGLGGAKRLVNDFSIESKPGLGTKISITRWK